MKSYAGLLAAAQATSCAGLTGAFLEGCKVQVETAAGAGILAGVEAVADQMTGLDRKVARYQLIYDIEVAENVGFQIIYDSATSTPTIGNPTTASFIGGGIYGYF